MNNQYNFKKYGILMILVTTFIFTNSYANISTDLFIQKDNSFIYENNNFNLAFNNNDYLKNSLKMRYDIDKGSYEYLTDVEVDFNFKNAKTNCIDLDFIQNSTKLEVQSNNKFINYIKSDFVKSKLCEFKNYVLIKKTSRINDKQSFDFDFELNKILQDEIDYEIRVFAKDENNEFVEEKDSGSIEIVRDSYEYSLQKRFNLNDCKNKADFEYNHTFSIYLYDTTKSCYYQIKHEDYKNMPNRLVKFHEGDDLDKYTQKNVYYELTITSLLDKRINDAGYYLNIYCEEDKSRESIYNSWVKIDFNCEYDSTSDKIIEGNDEFVKTNISFNENNNTIELENNENLYLNDQINLSEKEQNKNISSVNIITEKSFVEKLFEFLFGWLYK